MLICSLLLCRTGSRPTFSVDLHTSLNPIEDIPQRHAQRFAFEVTLDPVKFRFSINYGSTVVDHSSIVALGIQVAVNGQHKSL